MDIIVKDEKRIAKIENIAEKIRSESYDAIEKAYKNAVADKNEETAAELARKLRNKLLEESDKEVAFDRIGLNTENITSFFKNFSDFLKSDLVKYRQALRDLPTQEGFPFDVEFPAKPE